ncbi:MAG: tetratricopeptide repeat protein [Gemmataceae bacterium]
MTLPRTRLALGLLTALLLVGSAVGHVGGFRGGFGGVRYGGFSGVHYGGYGGGVRYGGYGGGFRYGGYSTPHYSIPNYSFPHYSAPRYTSPVRPSYNYGWRPSTYSHPGYLSTRSVQTTWPGTRVVTNRGLTWGTGVRVNQGWRPTVARNNWVRPPVNSVANRAAFNRTPVNINNRIVTTPRVAGLVAPSRNLVNTARFYNRPWGHYYPWYHGGWHGWGYWPRFWGGWGAGYGLGFSTGMALGATSSVLYDGSAIAYANPYYVPVPVPVEVPAQPVVIDSNTYVTPNELDYSRPIQVPTSMDVERTDSDVVTAAKDQMTVASGAFRRGDYAEAQRDCERAIHLLPSDTNLHEFRALCQFAQGKYADCAATLYAVLADGPGWDWNTLSSFYPDSETYTRHLRALEGYVRDNPRDPRGHFVLAYQYLVLDDRDVAMQQLREVIKLQPKDRISVGILEALQKDQKGDTDKSE